MKFLKKMDYLEIINVTITKVISLKVFTEIGMFVIARLIFSKFCNQKVLSGKNIMLLRQTNN